jgi:hypothetical protein
LRSKKRNSAAEKRGRAKIPCPNPLLFCPPERNFLEISVGIVFEKSSNFVQDRQPICKVSVSRLARGFAPRYGGRIFRQFPNKSIFFRPKGESKTAIYPPKTDCPKASTN